MGDDTKARIERTISGVQRRYEGHGRVFRVLWTLVAVTVVLAGLAMLVFPGPAIVVIPLGLAMLAVQFAWARNVLNASIDGGIAAQQRLKTTSTTVKVLGGAVLACLCAAVVAVLLLR